MRLFLYEKSVFFLKRQDSSRKSRILRLLFLRGVFLVFVTEFLENKEIITSFC